MNNRPLKTIDWLAEHLQDPSVRIIDASWHMPDSGRDAQAEYVDAHIPGAVYLSIDACAEPDHLPHSFPSAERFAEMFGQLGINHEHEIVVYDTHGLFSAARLWWMCRYFGAKHVSVLDGGLPAWNSAGLKLESGKVSLPSTSFEVRKTDLKIVNAQQVLEASEQASALILDARSLGRFSGQEQEIRPGLRSGHIPGSVCMPFTELVNNGYLRPNDELLPILKARGIDDKSPVITTCGSGVTAAIIILALDALGMADAALYDGSWSEWGAMPDKPVATGTE